MSDKLLLTANKTVTLLKEKGLKIATAESCTGGMLSSLITSVSGASSVIELGITSYSSRIKNQVLNVKEEDLRLYGAISEATASQMAENIRKISGADIGVSVTGNAGPDSSEGKPVGLVYIGFSNVDGTAVKKLLIEPKSRQYVREEACFSLLSLIINHLNP